MFRNKLEFGACYLEFFALALENGQQTQRHIYLFCGGLVRGNAGLVLFFHLSKNKHRTANL